MVWPVSIALHGLNEQKMRQKFEDAGREMPVELTTENFVRNEFESTQSLRLEK